MEAIRARSGSDERDAVGMVRVARADREAGSLPVMVISRISWTCSGCGFGCGLSTLVDNDYVCKMYVKRSRTYVSGVSQSYTPKIHISSKVSTMRN
jgi:hypothetical protein